MNSRQRVEHQSPTSSRVFYFTHVAHIRRLSLSDVFSPSGNTPFGLRWWRHRGESAGGGGGLTRNKYYFYVYITTTCIWMYPNINIRVEKQNTDKQKSSYAPCSFIYTTSCSLCSPNNGLLYHTWAQPDITQTLF